jgi:hypothetical protein
MKRLLRLFVMSQIKHDEDYYKTALWSQGINIKDLSHTQIALYKATMKQIEADLMIEMAYAKSKTSMNDFDYTVLLKSIP